MYGSEDSELWELDGESYWRLMFLYVIKRTCKETHDQLQMSVRVWAAIVDNITRLTPNDPYMGRTAPLT